MFGGLDPNEYQQLVEYSKNFGGISPLSVNRGVTADDVMAATSPLSQPTGGTAVEAVANFNNFLAGILSNKATRVASEKEKLLEQNEAAIARVDKALVPEDESKYFITLGERLIDTRKIGTDESPVVVDKIKEEAEPQTIKLTGGVEMTTERFDKLDQVDKNKLLGLSDDEKYLFKEVDKNGDLVIGIQKPDGTTEIRTLGEDGQFKKDERTEGQKNQDRILELRKIRTNEPDNWNPDLESELELLESITIPTEDYEKRTEVNFADYQKDLRTNKLNTLNQYNNVIAASNVILQKDFESGPLTSGFTFLQEVAEDLGWDIKAGFEILGINILNETKESELIESLTRTFGINTSDQLAGAISNLELVNLFKTTIRLSAPEEFNKTFIQGMEYLARAKVKETEIALASKSSEEFDKKMDEWFASEEGQPPSIFNQEFKRDPKTLDELQQNLNIDLKQILNQKEG